MWWENLSERLDPVSIKNIFLTLGGIFTALVSSLMGEHQHLFYWLFGFVVADYLSGIMAAAVTGTWSSKTGLKGLIKKFVILLVAIGFHGIDQILAEPWIGAWAIGALSLNELISVLENVERAGFGAVIPRRIRDMLAAVKTEHESKIKSKLGVSNERTL